MQCLKHVLTYNVFEKFYFVLLVLINSCNIFQEAGPRYEAQLKTDIKVSGTTLTKVLYIHFLTINLDY